MKNPRITSKGHHIAAIDISTDREINKDLLSICSGKVTKQTYDPKKGRILKIQCDNGYELLYAHLSAWKANLADPVRKGEVIAWSGGDKGSVVEQETDAPHLHFEVWKDGKIIPMAGQVKERPAKAAKKATASAPVATGSGTVFSGNKYMDAKAACEGYGKPGTIATRRNNPGNIRDYKNRKGDFAIYGSTEEGFAAMRSLLLRAYKGLTIAQAAHKWAPASDNNDTEWYIFCITSKSGYSRDTIIDTLL